MTYEQPNELHTALGPFTASAAALEAFEREAEDRRLKHRDDIRAKCRELLDMVRDARADDACTRDEAEILLYAIDEWGVR